MYATNQFRKGLKVEIEGIPYEIVDFQHVSPGKGRAFTRTKLKNMLNQNVIERTITSGDKLDRANTEEKEMQFLYFEENQATFMDQENYEQVQIDRDLIGEPADFLQDGMVVTVLFHETEALSVELPQTVIMELVEADPVVKGQTASSSYKPGKLANGRRVLIPPHMEAGTRIVVNTTDGSYLERAKD